MTRRLAPGGAHPYSPDTISRSVPQTPSASVRTRTAPSERGGSGISSSFAEWATLGATVTARMDALRGFAPDRSDDARDPRPWPASLLQRKQTKRVPNRGTGRFPQRNPMEPGPEPGVTAALRRAPPHFFPDHAAEPHNGPYRAQALGNRRGLHSFSEFLSRSHADFARNSLHVECK